MNWTNLTQSSWLRELYLRKSFATLYLAFLLIICYFFSIIFFIGSIMTAQIVLTDRHDGVWDRSIVAGVTSLEITFSHFVLQLCINVVQSLELMIVVYGIFQQNYDGNLLLMYFIVWLQGLCGMSYGRYPVLSETSLFLSLRNVFYGIIIQIGTVTHKYGYCNYYCFVEFGIKIWNKPLRAKDKLLPDHECGVGPPPFSLKQDIKEP